MVGWCVGGGGGEGDCILGIARETVDVYHVSASSSYAYSPAPAHRYVCESWHAYVCESWHT